MEIGAIGFHPYIYNTNTINRTSMNKIAAIPQDAATQKKVDYTGLVKENQENQNPLKPGETSNFQETLDRQMALSRQNATRIMPVLQ